MAMLAKDADSVLSRNVLPGDPDDHGRYLKLVTHGIVVACLYLPNGNPPSGHRFDYKFRWFDRVIKQAAKLYKSSVPAVLARDFNVVPTDFDIYDRQSWLKNALLQPESRARYARLIRQGGTDAVRECHPG